MVIANEVFQALKSVPVEFHTLPNYITGQIVDEQGGEILSLEKAKNGDKAYFVIYDTTSEEKTVTGLIAIKLKNDRTSPDVIMTNLGNKFLGIANLANKLINPKKVLEVSGEVLEWSIEERIIITRDSVLTPLRTLVTTAFINENRLFYRATFNSPLRNWIDD